MKITITINTENAAFEDDYWGELQRVLNTVPKKVIAQRERAEGFLCTALESDDILHDINGNRCGTILITE